MAPMTHQKCGYFANSVIVSYSLTSLAGYSSKFITQSVRQLLNTLEIISCLFHYVGNLNFRLASPKHLPNILIWQLSEMVILSVMPMQVHSRIAQPMTIPLNLPSTFPPASVDMCGRKFGRWYNMIWMEKIIGQHT